MSLKKVTLASLILLGLSACGSSGGGTSDSTVNQNTSQTAEQQAQADKLAAEQAEKERLAKEEAERLAAEQAEKERLAKEEAERLASEKSARLAELKANALKYGLSEEEATTYANNNFDQMNGMDNSNLYILVYDKVKAQALDAGFSEQEANDIANQYSIWNTPNMTLADTAKIIENLAVDKAEKERLAKEEAERLAAEEKARQEKLASLVAIAKEAGLTDSQAMQVAKNNMTSSEEQFLQAIETFKIDSAKGFSSNTYQQGFNHLNYSASASASNSLYLISQTKWTNLIK